MTGCLCVLGMKIGCLVGFILLISLCLPVVSNFQFLGLEICFEG